MPERKQVFLERRKKMLEDKIDFAAFLTWFIENYPDSGEEVRNNPDIQYNYR